MIKLTADQENAKKVFIDFLHDKSKNELVISGEGGTGKTYLIKELIAAARNLVKLKFLIDPKSSKMQILLTATTNKAARVLKDKINEPTQTIHSLLGLKVVNDYDTGETKLVQGKAFISIYNHLVIIDEYSMIEANLLKIIREKLPNCKIVYVGDGYQLLDIKGQRSIIEKEVSNHIVLTEIVRQDGFSPIAMLGREFRKTVDTGIFPKITEVAGNIDILSVDDYRQELKDLFKLSNPPNHTRAVMWRNNTVHKYNDFIHKNLTGSSEFSVGQLVLTNKPITAGPIGTYSTDTILRITGISNTTHMGIDCYQLQLDISLYVYQAKNQIEVTSLIKKYARKKDWNNYFKVKEEFSDLRNTYANTTYKCQGSTYNTVLIDLPDIGRNNNANEVARHLYVAITRPTDRIIFLGSLPNKYGG